MSINFYKYFFFEKYMICPSFLGHKFTQWHRQWSCGIGMPPTTSFGRHHQVTKNIRKRKSVNFSIITVILIFFNGIFFVMSQFFVNHFGKNKNSKIILFENHFQIQPHCDFNYILQIRKRNPDARHFEASPHANDHITMRGCPGSHGACGTKSVPHSRPAGQQHLFKNKSLKFSDIFWFWKSRIYYCRSEKYRTPIFFDRWATSPLPRATLRPANPNPIKPMVWLMSQAWRPQGFTSQINTWIGMSARKEYYSFCNVFPSWMCKNEKNLWKLN